MITSFDDKILESFWKNGDSRKIPAGLHNALRRKLVYLDGAIALSDLRIPPANHLEALKGDLAGFHSIRVNDQWRLVFHWESGSVKDLKLMDYHK